MILIKMPEGCNNERKYILEVVFNEWLGLDFQLAQMERIDCEVSVAGLKGSIRLPDIFFSKADKKWLDKSSLPDEPLGVYKIPKDISVPAIKDDLLPNIYAESNLAEGCQTASETKHIPLDIFGSAFFMLTGYEDVVRANKDMHGRFDSNYSMAKRYGFIQRPIIDEYVELVWAVMHSVWPSLSRKNLQFKMNVTCDLDHPFYLSSPKTIIKRLASQLIGRTKPVTAPIQRSLKNFQGLVSKDRYFGAIKYILDVNERQGNQVVFYLIPNRTNKRYDADFSIKEKRIKKLIQYITDAGHIVGIHPGYDTYNNKTVMADTIRTAKGVFQSLGVSGQGLLSRQHYLRWCSYQTPLLLDNLGVTSDSSFGFSDIAGFRVGTSREYPLYSLAERRKLNIVEKPLIVMESSILSPAAMNLTYQNGAVAAVKNLKDYCKRMEGVFTVLWHNSDFFSEEDHWLYEKMISIN